MYVINFNNVSVRETQTGKNCKKAWQLFLQYSVCKALSKYDKHVIAVQRIHLEYSILWLFCFRCLGRVN